MSTPINQLRREWYAKVLNNAKYTAQTPMSELEWNWLLKVVADGGGSNSEDDYDDLWRQMVAVLGKTPVTSIVENQKTYYQYAP